MSNSMRMSKKTARRGNVIIAVSVIAAILIGTFFLISGRKKGPIPAPQDSSGEEQTKMGESAVIAGRSSPFLIFKKSEYEKAVMSGKIVLLDFYANWCPICRAEAPELEAGFNSLTSDKLVGFRVNYNDSDTNSDEKALAEEFKVPYQHTKIILRGGREVARSSEVWDKETFLEEVGKFIQ